tara:strand:+ start:505 stop:789 length:285 start_codon:yes stop_codon:yes gene_type:complete
MDDADVICATARHTEACIIGPFIEHDRTIGCSHLLIGDDCSDDGTSRFRAAQKDVSPFRRINGAPYGENVATSCSTDTVRDQFMYVKQRKSFPF